MTDLRRVSAGGFDMQVQLAGSGVPLVLVHGFPLTHAMWREQLEPLAGHARLIVPDLRGFGGSDVTAGTVSMADFADDVAALLDALDVQEPVVFGGLSMGGYVAWEFWRRHRQRVRALLLCDTRAVADTPEAAQNRLDTADKVEAEGAEALVRAMLPKLLAADNPRREELAGFLREIILGCPAAGIAAASRGMAGRAAATDLLDKIDVPTLLVVGEHDAISTAEEMRGLAAEISKSELLVVPEAGHMAPLESPVVVNEAIVKFLQRV